MHLSITPFIRHDAIRKNGKTAIYVRVVYMRKPKSFSTGILISPENWDDKKLCVKKTEPLATTINTLLKTKMSAMLKQHYDNLMNDASFSFHTIKCSFSNANFASFKDFSAKEIENRPISKDSKKVLNVCRNHVLAFKPNVLLTEIDISFINQFKSYLQRKTMTKNTILGNIARLKVFITAAYKQKIIKENPFHNYKIGAMTPKQGYLTKAELLRIVEALPTLNDVDRNICTQFCFACFTGLRHSDLLQLNYLMLRQYEQYYFFELRQVKTKDIVRIPVNDFALKLIDVTQTKGKVFKVFTNQYYNRALKNAFANMGINTPITSHVARHTFITIGLQSGMQKEMVGKIAGHKKSSTTDGYTHLQIDDLVKEMQKFTISPAGGGY